MYQDPCIHSRAAEDHAADHAFDAQVAEVVDRLLGELPKDPTREDIEDAAAELPDPDPTDILDGCCTSRQFAKYARFAEFCEALFWGRVEDEHGVGR